MSNIEITPNDPNGVQIADVMFEKDTLTAGGAVTWAAGTVLARNSVSGKLTAYTSGGSNGENVPKAILPVKVVFTASGDKAASVITGGQVRRSKLVAHGVGAVSQAEVDALRDYTIHAVASVQNASQDNS